jgi:hypothetical protein
MPKYHYIQVRGRKRHRIDVDEVKQALLQHDLLQQRQDAEEGEDFSSWCAGCETNEAYLSDGQIAEGTTFYIVEHQPEEEWERFTPNGWGPQ